MSQNNNSSILDRPLGKLTITSSSRSNQESNVVVSLSYFAYLFSEMVQYHQNRVDSISELERRLEGSGYSVGLKVLELLAYRHAKSNAGEYKREIKMMNVLHFISTTVWKSLFGKAADSLERSIDHHDEFMIVDYSPITSTYVSVPTDFGGLSVDSYISGIITGILEGSAFPARVTAHTVSLEDDANQQQQQQQQHPSSSNTYQQQQQQLLLMIQQQQQAAVAAAATSSAVASSANAAAVTSTSSIPSSSSIPLSSLQYQASYSLSELTGTSLLPIRKEKTIFLVKFAPSVLTRDSQMG